MGKGLNYWGEDDYREAWGNGDWEEDYYYWHGGENYDGQISNLTMLVERGGTQTEGGKTETKIGSAANTETQPMTDKLRTATGGRDSFTGTENNKPIEVINRFQVLIIDDSDDDNDEIQTIDNDSIDDDLAERDHSHIKSKRQLNK